MRLVSDRSLLSPCVALALGLSALPPALAQDPVPRFEADTCRFERGAWARGLTLKCGWLVVAETRATPRSRVIRLAVAIMRAPDPNGDPPLVVLHGGPGDRGIESPVTRGVAGWSLARTRDIVVYDQRDAGLSRPVLCEEQLEKLRRGVSGAEDECVAALRAQGVDRASYSTPASAADLADLRRALGYVRWDIFAGSYGTRLALEAMRSDAAGIRSVVLNRALPPGTTAPEEGLATQQAVERLFAACATDASCGTAFKPAADFHALFADLTRNPLPVSTPGDTILLDGRRLVLSVRRALDAPATLVRVPFLLHQLRHGNRTRAASALVGNPSAAPLGFLFRASHHLINCYDQFVPDVGTRFAAVRAQLTPPFQTLRAQGLAWCPRWQDRFASEDERAPVRSDIPTLIIAGEFDTRTPPSFARRIASTLSRAHVIELPGEGHDGRLGECARGIVSAFLRDPTRAPDASCVSQLPSPRFVMDWPEQP